MPGLRDFQALIDRYPDASDEELLALARGGGAASAEGGGLPSFLKDAWDWGNRPLVDLADDAFGDSAAGRFGVGLAESLTSPLSVAGLALSGGASAAGKLGLLGLSRGARAAEAALNVPYIAEGLSTLAGADGPGEATGGAIEAALGSWGLAGALRRPTVRPTNVIPVRPPESPTEALTRQANAALGLPPRRGTTPPALNGPSLADEILDSRIWNDERGSLPLGGIGEPDLPYEAMVAETLDGGGASRFLDGRSPSQGAMVGGVVPPQTLETLTPEALARFAREHRAALEAAPNRTLGAFRDKGAFDLDVSENVGGLEEALRLARDRGEKSVFDLGTYETYPNPAHPDTATHWQELQHRSKVRGLTAVDPEFQGRGQAGDERARRGAWPQDYVARTFWNTPESLVEGNIAKLPQQYTGFVPKATLLDQADPLYRELEEEALRRAAAEGNTSQARVQTLLERLIKDHPAGFAGMKLTETMDPAFTQPVDPEWLLEQTILRQSPMEREPYVSLNRSARFMRQPTSSMSPMVRQEVQTFGRRPLLPASVIEELRRPAATDAVALARAVGDSGPIGPDPTGSRSATTGAGSAGGGLASALRVAQDPLKAASQAGADEVARASARNLDRIWAMEPPAPIRELEEAWVGGVGDLGTSEAAYAIQSLDEFGPYQDAIQQALRHSYGDTIPMYRALTRDALADWRNGADIGPVSFTTSRGHAEAWPKLAMNEGKDYTVVQTDVPTSAVLMRGSEPEAELVIDGNAISADTLRELGLKGAPAMLAAPAAMDEDGELDPIQLALATAGLGVAGMAAIKAKRNQGVFEGIDFAKRWPDLDSMLTGRGRFIKPVERRIEKSLEVGQTLPADWSDTDYLSRVFPTPTDARRFMLTKAALSPSTQVARNVLDALGAWAKFQRGGLEALTPDVLAEGIGGNRIGFVGAKYPNMIKGLRDQPFSENSLKTYAYGHLLAGQGDELGYFPVDSQFLDGIGAPTDKSPSTWPLYERYVKAAMPIFKAFDTDAPVGRAFPVSWEGFRKIKDEPFFGGVPDMLKQLQLDQPGFPIMRPELIEANYPIYRALLYPNSPEAKRLARTMGVGAVPDLVQRLLAERHLPNP